MKDSLRTVAVFELAVGVGVITWWAFAIPTGRVPEIAAGERAIWFHIGAEVLMAALLIAAGIELRTNDHRARLLSALALGALVYSAVNSAGFFADERSWAMVAVLGVVAAAAGIAFFGVLRTPLDDDAAASLSTGSEGV